MNIDEMIAVLQAWKEGKQIQVCSRVMPVWEDKKEPIWNFGECRYRIKPEPRRFWVNIYSDQGDSNVRCHSSKVKADRAAGFNRIECIEVVEVMKEQQRDDKIEYIYFVTLQFENGVEGTKRGFETLQEALDFIKEARTSCRDKKLVIIFEL